MSVKDAPTVVGYTVDADRVHIGGSMFARVRECKMLSDFDGHENYDGEELYPVYAVKCSACGEILWDTSWFNYCPSCGAVVKEDVDGE